MYDASFDDQRAAISSRDRRWLWAVRLASIAAVLYAVNADAQIPGLPVLQNAWATAGMNAALDIGGGDGSVYAGALSWTPAGGHFEVSGGAGYRSRTGAKGAPVYGLRAAIPFGSASGSFGFAAFAGIGGGGSSTTHTAAPCLLGVTPGCVPVVGAGLTDTGTVTVDSTSNSLEIPIGVGIGWRRAIGGAHGVSVYATPSYVFFTGGSKSGGLIRAALAADVGITPAIGATLGVEFGGKRPRGAGGPSGVLYGLGVSYAFGHR